MTHFDLQFFAGNAAGSAVNYGGDGVAANAGTFNTVTGETVSGGDLTAEMKTFYDKALIQLVGPRLVHEQFGQKRPIPKNGGRSIEFRKFDNLDKATTAITEGVTPAGNKLKVSTVTADLEQYGDYIEQTDLLEMTAIDNTVVEATKKLADQAGRTMDTVVRDIINAGTCRQFCPDKDGNLPAAREEVAGDCLLTVKEVFKAAARLKKRNAPTVDGSYVGIIHPLVSFDLMQEAGDQWVDVMKYAKPENILNGEIGKIGSVRFVETSEAKIFGAKEIGVVASLGTGGDAGKITLEENVPVALTDNQILWIGPAEGNVGDFKKLVVNGAVSTAAKVIATDGEGTTATADNCEAGYVVLDHLPAFSTLVLGADAYGVTDIAGGGIEHIVKQRGYGNDPLNQRSSVGWKGLKTAAILVEQYMQRIESAASLATAEEAN